MHVVCNVKVLPIRRGIQQLVQRPFAYCPYAEWGDVTRFIHLETSPTYHCSIVGAELGRWKMQLNIRITMGAKRLRKSYSR